MVGMVMKYLQSFLIKTANSIDNKINFTIFIDG